METLLYIVIGFWQNTIELTYEAFLVVNKQLDPA